MFSEQVIEQLRFYVYRLMDPRNGETFYVGRGTGNRVFEHVKEELNALDTVVFEKRRRISEIRRAGLEVAHVIHRHGLSEKEAHEVEAALVDAYPEIANEVRGYGSDERGVKHAAEIIRYYEAPVAQFSHSAVVITINRSIAERANVYEAVRYSWKIDPARARQAELVLAVERGLIVGVFIAQEWLPATPKNFPDVLDERPGRWGFVGEPAPREVANEYLGRSLPSEMRKRGTANPVRYV